MADIHGMTFSSRVESATERRHERFIVFDRRLHRTAFGDLLTTVVFLQGSGDVPGSEVCLTGFVLKSLRSVVP